MALKDLSKPNNADKPGKKSRKTGAWKKAFFIFLIFLACAVYPVFKIRWAKQKVENFCSRISVGMRVQGLEQRAMDHGLKVRSIQGKDSQDGKIMVWEGWAFARWFCEIEHSNGKVVHKEILYVD